MRLLHMISEKPPVKSGFSRVICRLSQELSNMGHVVDIVSSRDTNVKRIGEIKLVLSLGKARDYIETVRGAGYRFKEV